MVISNLHGGLRAVSLLVSHLDSMQTLSDFYDLKCARTPAIIHTHRSAMFKRSQRLDGERRVPQDAEPLPERDLPKVSRWHRPDVAVLRPRQYKR